ncbi:Agamous-like MADS-box protein AGL53 [Cardamine amara subsp. amara]|uniref:Agamous-like MADS-box protein AGL53 n=1 Tax=Cardamine amara subsp. amara TaxID=228776 RepID=A0ABD0ZW95_CARAN
MDSTKKNTKLSVKNQTCFKKSSFSSNNDIPGSRKKINLSMREKTIFNKAYELATLCDVEVCVIYYGPDGELIKTWPDDEHKVRDMAERFTKLNEKERRKKSTNLSQILNKKILNDKKTSLDNNDNKFFEKVSDLENSLENHLRIFQAKLLRLQTEPDDQSRDLFTTIEEDSHQQPLMNHKHEQDLSHTGGFTPLLIDDHNQQWTESLMGGVSSTEQTLMTSSLNQQQNKFSLFLYNHGNGSFCQLPDYVKYQTL